jgi:alpha-glucoside transport system permease protein
MTTTTPPVPVAATGAEQSTMVGRARRRLTSRGASLAAILIAVTWTIPTFGLAISSFRPERKIMTTGWWTFFGDPQITLENYDEVLFGGSNALATYFLNSIVITVPAVLFPVLFAALAAYALSWMNWWGRDWAFIGIFALQIVPIQMALVPLIQISSSWGLEGPSKFWTVWIVHSIFAMPLAVFLLHNFMSELPRELIEAARVDGADHARIFRSVALPLIIPALAAYGIFQFLWVWNDLLVALIFAGGTPETAPLTVRLADLASTRGDEWQRLTAGAFVSIAVPLAVFIGLQRYFVRGLLAGGLKG